MKDIVIKVVSASWCGQCGPYKKQLEQSGIEFENIDADDESNMELLKSLGVRSLPTTLVYKNGELIKTFAGNKPQELKAVFEGD